MQMWLKVFTERHNTSRHYMWRFITDLSAVINTGWAETNIKTVPHSAKSISIIDMIETRTIWRTISEQLFKTLERVSAKIYWFLRKGVCLECFQELFLIVVVLTSYFDHKNSLRAIEAQIVQKLKNNEARSKFTGSYKKKRVLTVYAILNNTPMRFWHWP